MWGPTPAARWAGQAPSAKSGSTRGGFGRRPSAVARAPARSVAAAAAVLSLCGWACCPQRLFALPPQPQLPPQVQAPAAADAASSLAGGPALRMSRSASIVGVGRRAAAGEAGGTGAVRVGVLYIAGVGQELKEAFEKRNVTNATFFQTEVPDAFQMPLAAKLLAMSNTVDVVVAAHGDLGEEKSEVLRGYQSVALTANVPIVPYDGRPEGLEKAADVAVAMGEIRQQALFGAGARKSTFFGIGANQSESGSSTKKDKVYF